jgi:hypothetical protein
MCSDGYGGKCGNTSNTSKNATLVCLVMDGMAGAEVMCYWRNDGGRGKSSDTPGRHALIPSTDNCATNGKREELTYRLLRVGQYRYVWLVKEGRTSTIFIMKTF